MPQSAILLRRLLGPITLRPAKTASRTGFFVAETKLSPLVLLENEPPSERSEGGSTHFVWWRRREMIRTVCELPVAFPLTETEAPLFQRIAPEVARLRALGLTCTKIARHLEVTDKTVAKAERWGRPARAPLRR